MSSPASIDQPRPLFRARSFSLSRPGVKLFVAGLYALLFAAIVLPLGSFLAYSFMTADSSEIDRSFSLNNYRLIFSDALYLSVFWQTFKLAALVAAISLVCGYIIAYLAWRLSGAWRYAVLFAAVVPLVMSYVIKLYAMSGLFGFDGVVNSVLLHLGALKAPSRALMFNQNSVLVSMCIIYLPFAILPVFLSLDRIAPNLLEAAADLGGKPGQIFRMIVLPLSAPGSVVGALFVMILALGDFLTPQMVGGNQGFTFGRIVWSQFGLAYNWPLGAALSVFLFGVTLVIIIASGLVSRKASL